MTTRSSQQRMMRREQRFVVSLGNEQYLGELEFAVMHKFKITVEEFELDDVWNPKSNFNFFLCCICAAALGAPQQTFKNSQFQFFFCYSEAPQKSF